MAVKVVKRAAKSSKAAKLVPKKVSKDTLSDLIDRLERVLDQMVELYDRLPEEGD